ncbi:UDP-2-acetamido-2,6-beta-L-arabino-hexul-4-ose reductase [Pantoea sp. FN0302]|uniref:UDP-2-acetamido-2,6-beta-L-arabino-hexul-4-ose reductase n=1 Tax=Pantoea sp. FN0302 TaxID=3418558 RepID=UPI003CECBE51
MKVLITGADGFIGKNLCLRLAEYSSVEVVSFTRRNEKHELPLLLQGVDFVYHLAGVNRPQNPDEFIDGNSELTRILCDGIASVARTSGRKIPLLLTSSIHAAKDTPYGNSKRIAEDYVVKIARDYDIPIYICRLPGVFGKWARPNYNSVVATFCYNVAHNLPINIDNPDYAISLVYIDDVINVFSKLLNDDASTVGDDNFLKVTPVYEITVGQLATAIQGFKTSRDSLIMDRVGSGLTRALYSTFISYIPTKDFSYSIPEYKDPRGSFVEVIKTRDSGQFSYFTAHPGVTRGGHYHHTKTEKFLVIKGTARFRFRHMLTNESYELVTSEARTEIVETIPGWSHDVTNIGEEELVALVWANENFDRNNPDTIASTL